MKKDGRKSQSNELTSGSTDSSDNSYKKDVQRKKKRKRDRSPSPHKIKKRKKTRHRSGSTSSDERPTKHKSKSKKKKDKKEHKVKKHKKSSKDLQNALRKLAEPPEPGPSLPIQAVAPDTSRRPMTKEEWERQQSETKRVFDPDTGRMRLLKGSGEIVEEIVSRERQREINKMATKGDGISYSLQTGTLR